jgi:small subunit ribosomal protein S8
MAMNDTLAVALSNLLNAERIGRKDCLVHPISKVTKAVLDIMNKEGYIGSYEETDDGKGGILKINLLGAVNKCGVVKPRFSVKKDGYEKFEKRYLPAQDFGLIIVSTPKGIMTHMEAKEKGLGGRLLAYIY